MIVLGVDPGLAALGLALVDIHTTGEELLELAVIRTEKSARKLAVRAAEDQHRRACELVAALDERIQQRGVAADAAGVVLTCLDAEVIRVARRLSA